ncbi:MAG: flavodoxin family protein [bacterium]|nr:flavodoxin family protein [bacterium]
MIDNHVTALFINCSLKKTNKTSHTQRLINRCANILIKEGVEVESLFAAEYQIAFGMEKDLAKDGKTKDEWPVIQKKIMAADIFVLGTPIWLGTMSSIATLVTERMYAYSSDTNQKGQFLYYGKTAGVVVTGNEDGAKAVAASLLYKFAHIGYVIPPQPDTAWLGEAGPGPSYGDTEFEGKPLKSKVPTGYDNDYTNRTATSLAWNLMHMAKILKANQGFPTAGNLPNKWQEVTNAKEQDPESLD